MANLALANRHFRHYLPLLPPRTPFNRGKNGKSRGTENWVNTWFCGKFATKIGISRLFRNKYSKFRGTFASINVWQFNQQSCTDNYVISLGLMHNFPWILLKLYYRMLIYFRFKMLCNKVLPKMVNYKVTRSEKKFVAIGIKRLAPRLRYTNVGQPQ